MRKLTIALVAMLGITIPAVAQVVLITGAQRSPLVPIVYGHRPQCADITGMCGVAVG